MNRPLIWLDGQEGDHARLDPTDHGLLYGDGVFEGIRVYRGKAFYLDAHLERLVASGAAIGLDVSTKKLREVCERFARRLGDTGYLRVVVTRGGGPLGVDPSQCKRPSEVVIGAQLRLLDESVYQEGARCIIAQTRRLPSVCLDPRIKSLNYITNVQARREARAADADEALMLNSDGRLAEGSTDNLFLVQSGALFTPPSSEGALEGITRRIVMQLARSNGIAVHEQPLPVATLANADEVFLTGTAMELVPVRQVDAHSYQVPGPLFRQLQQAFTEHVAEHTGEPVAC